MPNPSPLADLSLSELAALPPGVSSDVLDEAFERAQADRRVASLAQAGAPSESQGQETALDQSATAQAGSSEAAASPQDQHELPAGADKARQCDLQSHRSSCVDSLTPVQPGEIPSELQAQIVRDATAAAIEALRVGVNPDPQEAARQIAKAGVLAWQIVDGRATEPSSS